jgi:hypothetical protein
VNLYAIAAEHCGRVRVGVTSTTVEERRKALQRECPDDLRTLGWSTRHAHLVRRVHAALAKHRVRGDWYAPVVGLAIVSSGDFGAWLDTLLGSRADARCACGAPARALALTCGALECVRRAKGARTGARPLVVAVKSDDECVIRAT